MLPTAPPLPFNAGTEKEILLGPLLTTVGKCACIPALAIVAVRIMDNRWCPAAGAWAAEMVFRLPWRERRSGKELMSLTTGESWPQHPRQALCKVPSGGISREPHNLQGECLGYPHRYWWGNGHSWCKLSQQPSGKARLWTRLLPGTWVSGQTKPLLPLLYHSISQSTTGLSSVFHFWSDLGGLAREWKQPSLGAGVNRVQWPRGPVWPTPCHLSIQLLLWETVCVRLPGATLGAQASASLSALSLSQAPRAAGFNRRHVTWRKWVTRSC